MPLAAERRSRFLPRALLARVHFVVGLGRSVVWVSRSEQNAPASFCWGRPGPSAPLPQACPRGGCWERWCFAFASGGSWVAGEQVLGVDGSVSVGSKAQICLAAPRAGAGEGPFPSPLVGPGRPCNAFQVRGCTEDESTGAQWEAGGCRATQPGGFFPLASSAPCPFQQLGLFPLLGENEPEDSGFVCTEGPAQAVWVCLGFSFPCSFL